MYCPQKFNEHTMIPNGHIIGSPTEGCQCEKEKCAWWDNVTKCCAVLLNAVKPVK